jgi:tetratricopeptide (TPR) repeat protein
MLSDKRSPIQALSLIFLIGSICVGCDDPPPKLAASQSKLAIAATRKLQLGDLKGALKDYNQAILQNPKEADVYVNRGIVQDELGQPQAAIADYSKALDLKPDLHLAYYNRANAQMQMKQYEKAIADYNRAIEIDPDYAYAYANRGSTQIKLGKKNEGIRDLQKAADIFASKNDQQNVQRIQRLLPPLIVNPTPNPT